MMTESESMSMTKLLPLLLCVLYSGLATAQSSNDSMYKPIADLFSGDISGYVTLGQKQVTWYNSRIDGFSKRASTFDIVEMSINKSDEWTVKLALPEQTDRLNSVEFFKFLISGPEFYFFSESGSLNANYKYDTDNLVDTSIGYEPIQGESRSAVVSSEFTKIGIGAQADISTIRLYYYGYRKPYPYDLTVGSYNDSGYIKGFELFDAETAYDALVIYWGMDTYQPRLVSKKMGTRFDSYFNIGFGFGIAQGRLSNKLKNEVDAITGESFNRTMNVVWVYNHSLEFGYLYTYKTKEIGYALSAGFFLESDLPLTNSSQSSGDYSLETSEGILGVEDYFYGTQVKLSLAW